MQTTSKCPECEETNHLRDVTRAEISCNCGLTLAGPPHRSVKYPDENYPDIPIAKFSHEHKSQKLKKEMESMIV
jgi:ribosomal protein L37AE/L43A